MSDQETWIVDFADGNREMRDLLGGKGANLCEMTRIGMAVPPGFVITTDACRAHRRTGTLPPGLDDQIDAALARLEARTGRRLGDPSAPLLVSVRSGARFSMPGMMDTVLDLGATGAVVDGLATWGGDWFAWDARRRFVEMFSRVVLGFDEAQLSERVAAAIAAAGVDTERDLSAPQMRALAEELEALVERVHGPMPPDPRDQLLRAVEAVFDSWDSDRARAYRRLEGIDDGLGTAVNVQMMVFGNLDDRSASGVAFTRDPATGERLPYGDFLVRAQGEDVVAGTRAPRPLAEMADEFPHVHAELLEHLDALERHERDVCDVEFTVESDRLWMLQTRIGKRSAAAAVRIAVDMVDEGLIGEAEALRRVRPEQVEQLLHPRFATEPDTVLTTGLAASPGAAVGSVCLSSDEARARGAAGESVILVRVETSPDDLEGMVAAAGLLTARGGLVSHAAVVARGLGRPAVCGASELDVDVRAGEVRVGDIVVRAGDVLSIDGSTGRVVVGAVAVEAASGGPDLERLLGFADRVRRLRVWANADTADDARRALEAGAEGIGLCRTEHQFLGDRLPVVQRLILAAGDDARAAALDELGHLQRADFDALLEVMDGRTTVIRLLDPPLHEFLPDVEELRLRAATGVLEEGEQALLDAAERLEEHNPMLGTRGIRLGVLRPAIYATQVRAIVEAAAGLRARGLDPRPEIMFPLVTTPGELAWGVRLVDAAVAACPGSAADVLRPTVATMIETPRAALCAGELAPMVDAFSFGTNDLTQLTFGLSRDDVQGSYVPHAVEQGLLDADPFEHLDAVVARLVGLAVDEGRAANPSLVTGICGEHGGDAASIAVADRLGLDHVSCAASRIRVARLAAARARLDNGSGHRDASS
ncbi:MAG: pyruvate, phosphate dikinase [Nitriliruptoraceae bacterium]